VRVVWNSTAGEVRARDAKETIGPPPAQLRAPRFRQSSAS
jgi:hypothetical protein